MQEIKIDLIIIGKQGCLVLCDRGRFEGYRLSEACFWESVFLTRTRSARKIREIGIENGRTCSCDTGFIENPAYTGDGTGCTDIGLHVRGQGAGSPAGRERVNRYVGYFESKWRRSG